ncbi:MAG: sirohydrochlorin chelatase [Magnetococcales bacterium]|nr:sirohydrochlorin chelatase [Magnetococcales bacterium]
MKETILLIGHGSRDVDGNEEIEDFADYWRQKRPDLDIEVCFIEFADVLVPDGLKKAAKKAKRVIAMPLILNAAGHVKMEIPGFIKQAREKHPKVTFVTGRHLGLDEKVLKLLRRRLHSAMAAMDMPDPKSTGVVVLGRGASDMDANGNIAKMARWLYETTRHELVEYAFTGVTYPRLESAVNRLVRLGATQVIVVPYYLFTGRLIKRIQRQVERIKGQYPTIPMGLAGYLGIHDLLIEVVEQRLEEAKRGEVLECDGCKFREIAEEHHDHHHHH